MNTPVTFPIGKLLKEKGYISPCYHFFDEDGEYVQAAHFRNHNDSYVHIYTAPLISEVVMWLYEKHGIWVSINPMHTDGLWGYEISVFCNDPYKGWFSEIKNYTFNSPTEASLAAIEYTLNNLVVSN